jgi:hypothetical protein
MEKKGRQGEEPADKGKKKRMVSKEGGEDKGD